MKYIIIGDVHGFSDWKEIIKEHPDYDKVIFVGDYLDSFTISVDDQVSNFKEILNFKKDNLDNVILLIGNHDYHYSNRCPAYEFYSGYKNKTKTMVYDILNDAIANNLMQACILLENKYLISHAGITETWKNLYFPEIKENKLIDTINEYMHTNPNVFSFNGFDGYGDNRTQGPLWVRPLSLSYDKYSDYTQIVGHTSIREIKIKDNLVFIDCIAERDKNKQYITIENSEIKIHTLYE